LRNRGSGDFSKSKGGGRKGSLLAQAVRRSSQAGVTVRRDSWFSGSDGARSSSRANSVSGSDAGGSGTGARPHTPPGGRRGSAEQDALGVISQELLGMRRELRTTMSSISANFEKQQQQRKQQKKLAQERQTMGLPPIVHTPVASMQGVERLPLEERLQIKMQKQKQQEQEQGPAATAAATAAAAAATISPSTTDPRRRASRRGSRQTFHGMKATHDERDAQAGRQGVGGWAGDFGGAASAAVAEAEAGTGMSMSPRGKIHRRQLSAAQQGSLPGEVQDQTQSELQNTTKPPGEDTVEAIDNQIKRHLRRMSVTMMPDMPETRRLEGEQQEREAHEKEQQDLGQLHQEQLEAASR